MPDGLRSVEFFFCSMCIDTYAKMGPGDRVDLSRNSVACNRSVAVKCKETIERYPLMSRNL